jgi:hypothetical protein
MWHNYVQKWYKSCEFSGFCSSAAEVSSIWCLVIGRLTPNILRQHDNLIFKGWNVHAEFHMVLFLKVRHEHPKICGATFQKNRDISVNHIIIASVNAVLTVLKKLERHLFILLWIIASVTMELTFTHECQPLKFMIPSHINPMSPTNSKKGK